MAGSTFGSIFKVTTWGESHGKGVGVVVDGCPAGLALDEQTIQKYLNRRKPGQTRYSTPRKEEDLVEIQSGIFEGKTTGTPISLVVYNKTQRSKDYSEIAGYYRPGQAYTRSIGGIDIDETKASMDNIMKSPLYMPDLDASEKAELLLEQKMKEQDSAGGVIECVVRGMPAGIGEPVFEKLDANLAKAVMSIGAVKGVEIGDGFAVASAFGSDNNDSFVAAENGSIAKKTNHAGGILGGMSDGSDIILRAAVKPTPSIARKQQTVNRDGEDIEISIKGRHDPVIVPRAVVVVEAMSALCVLDMVLLGMTSRLDKIQEFWKRQ